MGQKDQMVSTLKIIDIEPTYIASPLVKLSSAPYQNKRSKISHPITTPCKYRNKGGPSEGGSMEAAQTRHFTSLL